MFDFALELWHIPVLPASYEGDGICASCLMFHCVQCIDVGDVVVGVVTALLDAGILVTLLAVEDGMARDIDQLKITVCLSHVFYRLLIITCLLYTSPSPRDGLLSRMPSSA